MLAAHWRQEIDRWWRELLSGGCNAISIKTARGGFTEAQQILGLGTGLGVGVARPVPDPHGRGLRQAD
ncbi:hypothetical protein [Arthrobacter sp. MMS24-S77]